MHALPGSFTEWTALHIQIRNTENKQRALNTVRTTNTQPGLSQETGCQCSSTPRISVLGILSADSTLSQTLSITWTLGIFCGDVIIQVGKS